MAIYRRIRTKSIVRDGGLILMLVGIKEIEEKLREEASTLDDQKRRGRSPAFGVSTYN